MSLSNTPAKTAVSRGVDRRTRDDGPPGGVERRVSDADRRKEHNAEYVSFYVGDQLLGIPVLEVQEVLSPRPITSVPLASSSVAGLLNLRGQIVTVVDLRRRLQLPAREGLADLMSIVVNRQGELFSLLVDSIGDVISVRMDRFSDPPATLDECWKQCCKGVYQLKSGLLIVIDVDSSLTESKEMKK